MAFMALFFWVFIPILLLYFIATALEQLLNFLILYSTAVNVVVGVILVFNVAVFLVLLLIGSRWRKAGRTKREYLNQYTGWQRLWRFWFKYLLILGPIWEGIIILLCVLYLVIQPLPYVASLL